MADAEGQNEDGQDTKVDNGLVLRVRVQGIRGLHEEAGPMTVSYTFEGFERKGEDEEEAKAITGEVEPPEEGGKEQTFANQDFEHPLAKAGTKEHDDTLLALVKKKFQFKVEGTVGGETVVGVFSVGVRDLVWLPEPDPDEEAPKDIPFVEGWFKVEKPPPEEGEDGEEPAAPAEPAEGEEPAPELFPADCEVWVGIELTDYVMTREEAEESNVLIVTIKGMHNLPGPWTLQEDDEGGDNHRYDYTAGYTIPSSQGLQEILAEAGIMIPKVPEPEPAEPEEGEGGEGGEGGEEGADGPKGDEKAAEEPEGGAQMDAVPKEEGEDGPKEKVGTFVKLQHTLGEVNIDLEEKLQRVEWNHTHQSFVNPDAIRRLKETIKRKTLFAVDIQRVLKDGGDYIYAQKYHGLAKVDLKEILNEDATEVTFRCPVGPHPEFRTPTEEEVEASPPPEGEAEEEQKLHNGESANPYLLFETYLVVTVATERPIVKKPPPPPAKLARVSEILPKRGEVKKYKPPNSGETEFMTEIKNVIAEISTEYAASFRDPHGSETVPPEATEARQQQLVRQLNSNGKYYDFKVKLSRAIVRIIKERFHQLHFGQVQMDPTDEVAQLNSFIREQVNDALVREFAPHKHVEVDETQKLDAALNEDLRLASEAEMRADFNKAFMHLQKRIVTANNAASKIPAANNRADLWYDLGVSNMRARDIAQAEECFREAIKLDAKHCPSLLAFGVLLCVRDKYPEAEAYFSNAAKAGNDVLSWAMNVVFFDLESRDLERRSAMKQMMAAEKKAGMSKKSPYFRAAAFCVELFAVQMVEHAMTQELIRNGDSEDLRVVLGKAYLYNGQYDKSREHLMEALSRDKRCAIAMSLMGHNVYMELGWQEYRCDRVMPSMKEATSWYEKALAQKVPHIDMLQYYRLARMQIAGKKFLEAQDILTKACKLTPSATTWLGVAICFYFQAQNVMAQNSAKLVEQAEEALQEAAILDSQNAEVWGMTCNVCLLQAQVVKPGEIYQPKADEAVAALKKALMYGISTTESFPTQSSILEQVGVTFNKVQRYESSAAAVRRALDTEEKVAEAMMEAIAYETAVQQGSSSPKQKQVEPREPVNMAHKDAVFTQFISLSKLHADSCEMINDLASAVMSLEKILQVMTTVTSAGKTDIDGILKKLIIMLKQEAPPYRPARLRSVSGTDTSYPATRPTGTRKRTSTCGCSRASSTTRARARRNEASAGTAAVSTIKEKKEIEKSTPELKLGQLCSLLSWELRCVCHLLACRSRYRTLQLA